jgi:HEAT repeat protein
MTDESWFVRTRAIDAILRLSIYGITLARLPKPADFPLGDLRAKIVESTALAKTIALLKDSDSDVRKAAIDAIIKLVVYGTYLLGIQPSADRPSDDIRSQVIEPTFLANFFALLKDSDSSVRTATIMAIGGLAEHGMNLLWIAHVG